MHTNILFLILILILLTACSAVTPTPTPTPTYQIEPNLIPATTAEFKFPQQDIETILSTLTKYVSGVTSYDYTYNQTRRFSHLPPAQQIINQRLQFGTTYGGQISILFYANPIDLRLAYENARQLVYTPRELPEPGEIAVIDHNDLVFIRCFALVYIQFVHGDPDILIAYSRVLDAKITPIVCASQTAP
jgi:hypothetical protein